MNFMLERGTGSEPFGPAGKCSKACFGPQGVSIFSGGEKREKEEQLEIGD